MWFRLDVLGDVLGERAWVACGPGWQEGSPQAVDVLRLAAAVEGLDLDQPADCVRAAVAAFRGGRRERP